MSEQHSTSHTSVALAASFLLLSMVAFGAIFYVLDGQAIVAPLVSDTVDWVLSLGTSSEIDSGEASVPDAEIVLPPEMTEDFALRIWQEQVDSQAMIGRLIRGEVESMAITDVRKQGDIARLIVRVKLTDGTSGPGEIGLTRLGDDYYVAYATGMRSPDATGMAASFRQSSKVETTPLPAKEDVDAALLNALLVEQKESQAVIDEYVDGIVKEIVVEGVSEGPRTATVSVLMKETHGTAKAKIVAIRSEKSSEPIWFIARFTRTSSDHPNLK